MAIKAGVWIDHRKAVVVLITDAATETKQIDSGVEGPIRPASPVAEDIQERKILARLKTFYDEVIACIRDAEAILVFGPGQAKGELKKQLTTRKLGGRLAELETTDEMTDRQIAAKVRQHFSADPAKGTATRPARKRSKNSN